MNFNSIFVFLLGCMNINGFSLNKGRFNFKKLIAGTLIVSTFFPNVALADSVFRNKNFGMENQDMEISNSAKKIYVSDNDNSPILIQNNLLKESDFAYVTTHGNNIYFTGPVSTESCKMLSESLIRLNEKMVKFKNINGPGDEKINLHIQSPGGSIMNTFYIVDLIDGLETDVHTYVDGYAASAASLISVSGKKRFMTKNSLMLIHQLSSGKEGKLDELDDEMKNLNLFMKMAKDIYISKTKINPEKLNSMLRHDIWLTSDECKNLGLMRYYDYILKNNLSLNDEIAECFK